MPEKGFGDLTMCFTDVREDRHGGRDPDQSKQQLPNLSTSCAAALQVSLVLASEQLQKGAGLRVGTGAHQLAVRETTTSVVDFFFALQKNLLQQWKCFRSGCRFAWCG